MKIKHESYSIENYDLKKKVIKTIVCCIAFYGYVTWTLRKHDKNILQAFEMRAWRKMQNINWNANELENFAKIVPE